MTTVTLPSPTQAPQATAVVYHCAWCGADLGPTTLRAAGLGVCSPECAQELVTCGECGGDIRLPADPALGPAMCRNHRRSRGAA